MYDEHELANTGDGTDAAGELHDHSPPNPDPVKTAPPVIRQPDPVVPTPSPHPPWNPPRAATTLGVVGSALAFAAATSLLLGIPLWVAVICTLVLVTGILWLMMPREDHRGGGTGGEDKFILRLLHALMVLFGGGGGGPSGGGGIFGGRT